MWDAKEICRISFVEKDDHAPCIALSLQSAVQIIYTKTLVALPCSS